MDGLYDRDFVLWAEAEADKLRRLQRGERVNDVDWENLIEEVESLGRSEIRATQSLLNQAVTHILKVIAWPDARHRQHWMDEVVTSLSDARSAYTPCIRQRLEMDRKFRDARRRVLYNGYDGTPPMPLPEAP